MNNIILVTGVTGQDGSHMVDYLLKNTDYNIVGTVRRLSVSNHDNLKHIDSGRFEKVYFDLNDNESIQNVIQKYKPKYFINLAAQSFVAASWDIPVSTWNTNATGVLHILEAIRKYSPETRFYNAGTSEEFGDVQYSPQDESHPLRPRSPYGAAKAGARHLVKVYRDSYGIYAVQGWLFNHEGTRRGEEFVTRKISKGVAKIHQSLDKSQIVQPITLGNLEAKRDWSDAEDFVDGIWRMLNQDKYRQDWKDNGSIRDYVISSGETHTIREFIEESFKCINMDNTCIHWEGKGTDEVLYFMDDISYTTAGVKTKLVTINKDFYRPAEVELLLGSHDKISKELGWRPKNSFKDLVKKMVNNDIFLLESSP